jgi:cellulose synthase/poly-beta-1,6-N-acetylglucosamine synthase-like glycosyltransferase
MMRRLAVASLLAVVLDVMLGALDLVVLYLLVLTGAALWLRLRRPAIVAPANPDQPTRFAILIPAHDEELVLGDTLESLAKLDYPRDRFAIHVIADNCQDATAAIARSFADRLPVAVHERQDPERRGKGYAIEWVLARLAGQPDVDAYLMLDADWTVSANLLSVLDARLQSGDELVQVWCRVAHPEASWVAGLRYVAFALVNFVRPLGLSALGLSCGLKGTGMAFSARVIAETGWHSYSLIEDTEQHVKFLLAGRSVVFTADAQIDSLMPTTLGAAHSQNLRWESGKLAMLRADAGPLLAAAIGSGNWSALNELIGLTIPPLSIVAAIGLAGLVLAVAAAVPLATLLAIAFVVGLAVHVGVGLALTRPPRAVYGALLLAPLFILWKLRLYVAALQRRGRGVWVRTTRAGEVLH